MSLLRKSTPLIDRLVERIIVYLQTIDEKKFKNYYRTYIPNLIFEDKFTDTYFKLSLRDMPLDALKDIDNNKITEKNLKNFTSTPLTPKQLQRIMTKVNTGLFKNIIFESMTIKQTPDGLQLIVNLQAANENIQITNIRLQNRIESFVAHFIKYINDNPKSVKESVVELKYISNRPGPMDQLYWNILNLLISDKNMLHKINTELLIQFKEKPLQITSVSKLQSRSEIYQDFGSRAGITWEIYNAKIAPAPAPVAPAPAPAPVAPAPAPAPVAQVEPVASGPEASGGHLSEYSESDSIFTSLKI